MPIRNALIRSIDAEYEQLQTSYNRLLTLYAAAQQQGYDYAPEDLLEAATLIDERIRVLLDNARDDLTE